MGLVRPCVEPYCPAGHRVQLPLVAPARLYRPTGRMLAMGLGDVEPVGHRKPALQGPTQLLLVCPGTSPYCPAAQGPVQELVPEPPEP